MCIVQTTAIKGRNSTTVITPRPYVKDFWTIVEEIEKPLRDDEMCYEWDRDSSTAEFKFIDGTVVMVQYL